MEGRELGLVPATLGGDPRAATVDLRALADLLAEVAQDQALEGLRATAGPDGFGSPSDLPPDGIAVIVDAGDLAVDVRVPATLRRLVRLEVQQRSQLARGFMLLPPADVSAYVNMRAAIDYSQVPDGLGRDGTGPLSVAFEPALNLWGWVVEGDAFYREDADRRWARGPMRLVRDAPASSLRFQAGDLVTPVDGAQTGRPIGGISIARNYGLQPYRQIQPSGDRRFILDAPSVVEVYVNGRATRTFRLEPGPYDLGSLPGATGTNDVSIRIVDSFGRTQLIEFPFFFDGQLLAPGVDEFAYSLGYPYSVERQEILYDEDRLTFSGYHRLGVTDVLTVGTGLQYDRVQQNVSAEVLYTTAYGTFAVEPAASFAGPDGYGVQFGYRNYMRGEQIWHQRSFTAQVGWRDTAYRSFGAPDGRSDSAFDASFRFGQPISETLSATLGARWRESRSARFEDAWAVDLSLRKRLGRGDNLDVTLRHERDTQGETDTGLFASLRFTFGDDGQHAAGISWDTLARERRLDYRYQSLQPVDALTLTADVVNRAGGDRLQGSASYVHPRFLAQARHDLIQRDLSGDTKLENRTQLNLSTALAFADGHVGLTRPITNSFAIVVPHPRLKDRLIGVDPVNGGYIARTDWLGPPVVPNISAYLIRPLLLDVPDVPLGYDIGNDRPAIEPGYRTGTLVPIGTDAAVSLDGVLVMADGQPGSLQSGELRPVDNPEAMPIQFFSNRKGRFRLEAVRPGAWDLYVFGADAAPLRVDVPEDAEGLINLGTVTLRPN